MKRLSDGYEPIVRVPVIVEPVEVQVALVVVLVQDRNVEVAVRVTPPRAVFVQSAVHTTIRRMLERIASDLRFLTHEQKTPSIFILTPTVIEVEFGCLKP